MLSKQIKSFIAITFLLGLGLIFLAPGVSFAQTCPGGGSAPDGDVANCPPAAPGTGNSGGGGSPVSEEDIGQQGALTADCKTTTSDPELNEGNCKIIGYLVTGINVLSGLAGLAMVFSFIFAGYQYITARDNPQFVQAAKNRILWTLIALFTFLFMYAGLNWLVPGGVLP